MKKIISLFLISMLLVTVCSTAAFASLVPPQDAAVYVDNDSSLTGSSIINGDMVLTNGELKVQGGSSVTGVVYTTPSVKLNGSAVNAEEYTGEKPNYEPYESKQLPDSTQFANNHFSDGTNDLALDWWDTLYLNNYLLKENAFINYLSVPAGLTLRIEAPADTARVIRVHSLSVSGSIEIEGNGNVVLYVDDAISLHNAKLNVNTMDPNRLTLVLTNENEVTITDATKLGAHIVSSVKKLNINTIEMTGNLYSNGDVHFTNDGEINGLVYAPGYELKMTGSARINGQVVASSLNMSGHSVINYKETSPLPGRVEDVVENGGSAADPSDPDIDDPGTNDPDDVIPPEGAIRVVEYDANSNTYRSGYMNTKAHTPIGVDVTYTVLDEATFVPDGRTVGERDKTWVKTICDVANSVFDFRRSDVSLYPFGRVDFEAYQYALTISPYIVPILKQENVDVKPDSWLVWGDRNGHVTKVWMTIE